MYAYMLWADTTAGIMKMRNGANSAWISLWELDGTFIASDISLAAGSAAAPSLFFTGDTNTGLFSPGADTVALATAGSNRLHITSAGNVGIGTTSPAANLHVASAGDTAQYLAGGTSSSTARLYFLNNTANSSIGCTTAGNELAFYTGASERARIDGAGRLLVGTSSASAPGGTNSIFQTEATSPTWIFAGVRNTADSFGPSISLTKTRGTTPGSTTTVINGDQLGGIYFLGANGSNLTNFGASIEAYVDGTVSGGGANDMPGRLVFSVTKDGASSPTEALRIANTGVITGTSDQNLEQINFYNTNESLASSIVVSKSSRAASSAYYFFAGQSSGGSDNEVLLRGDGNGLCDGAWTGGGADYAEYFEWSDSNSDEEDRRGISVVLDGDKIREAVAGEDPIGVISGNPSVVGDAAWNKWSGKYLRDQFGTYIQEDYEVTDDDGNTVTQQRRKLNPAYDPDQEYVNREQRPEWDCVGLMGKLRIRKGQPTGSRWIKMRDISDSVEEWLVR